MIKFPAMLMVIFMLFAMNVSHAYGYGTSSISLSQNSVKITSGGSQSLDYSVNLASGSTWGTTIAVANPAKLSSEGISVALSNTYADPTYSGTLTVSVSASSAPGTYAVVLSATGDDPSTSNTTLAVYVIPAATHAANSTQANSTAGSTATSTVINATSTVINSTGHQSNSTANYTAPQQYVQASGTSGASGVLEILAILIIIVSAYLVTMMKYMPGKLVLVGVALILIGTVTWLYGDFSGGQMGYIYAGVIAILAGTGVWLYGDYAYGMLKTK